MLTSVSGSRVRVRARLVFLVFMDLPAFRTLCSGAESWCPSARHLKSLSSAELQKRVLGSDLVILKILYTQAHIFFFFLN